jgi:hypothetical protein
MKSARRRVMNAWKKRLEGTFAAVAFAEAGLPETAMNLMKKSVPLPGPTRMATFLEEVGLRGVPLYYGVARI